MRETTLTTSADAPVSDDDNSIHAGVQGTVDLCQGLANDTIASYLSFSAIPGRSPSSFTRGRRTGNRLECPDTGASHATVDSAPAGDSPVELDRVYSWENK